MNADLHQWLSELRTDGVVFADEYGGANANLWSISLPSTSAVSVDDLAAFVLAAAAIRAELVAVLDVAPITFYAWHDEMAGQLRFSTALCTCESLPFAVGIQLVEHPEEVVRRFLSSPYRDGVPWSTMRTDGAHSPDEVAEEAEGDVLQVWAKRLK